MTTAATALSCGWCHAAPRRELVCFISLFVRIISVYLVHLLSGASTQSGEGRTQTKYFHFMML